MVSRRDRDWLLVGPWYRWGRQRQQHGWRPRETRPVLQKYDTPDPVTAFTRDPQRSLRFVTDDQVHALQPIAPGGNGGKPRRRLSDSVLVPTGVRKLFLAGHKRFYLVVCELRSDAPGFPCVPRAEACEAGFVIRRRTTVVPTAIAREAVDILRELVFASAQLAHVHELASLTSPALGNIGGAAPAQLLSVLRDSFGGRLADQRSAAEVAVAEKQARLGSWAAQHGVRPVLQGWIPSEFEGIGSWETVAEKPAAITEQVYPLYPLVPDPAVSDHAGRGHNLYFGLVPTGSPEADAHGTARFDDRELYEIRCFVRRHRPRCPRLATRNDCPGPLVWSAPTEPYRLAAHFDLTGTNQRPITIQLPDIPALAAQAAASPISAPVKMISPPGSALRFRVEDMKPEITGPPGASICSFSIPLITIIAMFVLNLFLPVVIFTFGLWFMLRLKFCIPPSIEVGAAVTAALELSKAGIDVDADVGINVDLDPGPGVLTQAQIQTEVRTSFEEAFDAEFEGASLGGRFAAEFSPGVLATQNAELGHDFEADPPAPPPFTAGLEFEARVTTEEEFA